MLASQYCPRLADERIEKQGSTFDDGAGHQLGIARGRPCRCTWTARWSPRRSIRPRALIKGILVNKLGKRFVDEDCYHSRSSAH